MAALIPLVAQIGATAIISALGAGAVASTAIIGAATLAGAYISSRLQPGQKAKDVRTNYVSTDHIIPVVYGKRLVGGNIVFTEVGWKGEGTSSSKTKYLWVVVALCEGEIEGINQVDIDGVLKDEIYLNKRAIWTYGSGVVSHWVYTGTDTQVNNPILEAGSRKGKTDKFTDAMRNTAYLVLRLRYKSKVKDTTDKAPSAFNGVPEIESVVKGVRCLDLRTSTVSWTNNPALILYDYMTNARYGLGFSPSKLNIDSVKEAATYCDSHGTSHVWDLNYVLNHSMPAQSIMDTIMSHFRGVLYSYNGQLYFKFADLRHEPSVFNITDDHIVVDSQGKPEVSISQPSRFSTPDGIIVDYVDEKNNWTADRVVVGESEGQIKTIAFEGYTSKEMALEMATYVLERERLNRSITMVLRPDTVALDINDVVDLNIEALGLYGKLARIKSNSISSTGLIMVTAIFEDMSLYNTEYDEDVSKIYSVDFPGVSDNPPSVSGVIITESTYEFRGRSAVRLSVSFDFPDVYPWFSHVGVYVAIVGYSDDDPIDDDYQYLLAAYDDFQIDNVEEGKVYHLRLSSISTYGISQEDSDSVHATHTVQGASAVIPADPGDIILSVSLATVDMISEVGDNVDISAYEFRLGETWDESIFLTLRSSPSVTLSGVKPSTSTPYKFWMSPKHWNGSYCENPKEAETTIESPPPGSNEFFSSSVNYSTGISTNMTVTGSYPNQSMYCSHTGGVLNGEYVTVEIPTGNDGYLNKMVVYLLFDFSVIATGDSWDIVAPAPNTWEDFAKEDGVWKTWDEIFHDPTKSPAPSLDIEIDYSVVSGGPYTTVKRAEILYALVVGKFIKIRYKIKDINLGSKITIGPSTFKASNMDRPFLIGH